MLARAEKTYAAGEYGKAETEFQLAEETAKERFGESSLEYAAALNIHAGALCGQKKHEAAVSKYELAAEIRKRKLGSAHRDYAVVLNNLGFCQLQAENLTDAARNLQTARTTVSALKPEDPILFSLILGNLGEVAYRSGKQAEAEKHFAQAVALLKRSVSEDDPMLGTAYNNLGYVSSALGKYPQAISLYEAALKIMEKHYGPDHPEVAHALHNLSESCRESGDEARAPPKLTSCRVSYRCHTTALPGSSSPNRTRQRMLEASNV